MSRLRITGVSVLLASLGLAAADETPHRISNSGRGAYEVSLAPTSRGFAAAWYDTRDGHPEIYLRLLDRQGRPSAAELRLTNGAHRAYEADIASMGDRLLIAWYEVSAANSSHAMLGAWGLDGRRLWSVPLALPQRISKNAIVRATERDIFCAWLAEDAAREFQVYGAWFDRQGNLLADPQRLGPASQTTWNLNATIDERGRAWMVFDARANTRTNELFVARVEKTSSTVSRLTADDDVASKYPDLAVAGDRVALTWFDERDGNKEVYLFVGAESDLKEGLEGRATRVTRTPGESIGAYVAWNAKRHRFGLAWCDNTEGQHEIYFQSIDERGAADGPSRRLTFTRTESLIPAIKPSGDGFAIVWNEYAPGGKDTHESEADRSEAWFTAVR